jgi:hypothetical protein
MNYFEKLEYFHDEVWMDRIWKAKSGYYVRDRGWNDGESGKLNPPAREGYYFKEYMRSFEDGASGLPF